MTAGCVELEGQGMWICSIGYKLSRLAYPSVCPMRASVTGKSNLKKLGKVPSLKEKEDRYD